MTMLNVILLVALILVLALYISSKLKNDEKLSEIINEVKDDLKATAINVSELVSKAKNIVFDDAVQKTIKEFIMIVEEKNNIAKIKGEQYLSGDEKKLSVISRLTEWISNTTGSADKAIEFVESNQSKIETIIDEYISFSNKMVGKTTLSEAEKIIQQQLNK